MCTLSWLPLPGGYAVAMNRDERPTRAPALPPAVATPSGIPALIPIDGEAGGSWISVNSLGHTLALLNRFEDSPLDPGGVFVSRGLLLTELAGHPGPQMVDRALAGMPLVSYRPFTLASISPASDPWLFEWNGRALERARVNEPGMLRTSSGRDQAGAERVRGALFREAKASPRGLTKEALFGLHRSHRPERGPLSICMHREEANTVSCSLITVSNSDVLFSYVDGPPGEVSGFSSYSLPRLHPESVP
jgi:hypothetical protein